MELKKTRKFKTSDLPLGICSFNPYFIILFYGFFFAYDQSKNLHVFMFVLEACRAEVLARRVSVELLTVSAKLVGHLGGVAHM